jgi:PHS family inorganic phosphate transporter-like MFS transporter
MISKIWYKTTPSDDRPRVWNTDVDVSDPQNGIYTILLQNSIHSLIISSIGAILGGTIMIFAIDKFNRKRLQLVTFVVLGFLFIITGATFSKTVNTDFHGVTITLYCLCQLCFYFGPNTLTFIIPAELFPTKYRATCHGISAASGKLGSIITQVFLVYVKFSGQDSGTATPDHPYSNWLGYVLLIFALPMFIGAVCTYYWIPNLQRPNLSSYPLEKLVFVKDIQEEDE